MADSFNISFNSLKIKGTKGQSIDLTKLAGLQITEKNKSLFSKFDTNKNDGKIDDKEAKAMSEALAKIAGNGTISKREIEKVLGKGTYEELTKLASQQKDINQKGVYKEDNIELRSDGTRIETDPKTFHTTETSPNGKITVKDSRGVLLSTTEIKDGQVVTNEYLDLGYGTYIKTFNGEGDFQELKNVSIIDNRNNKKTVFNTEEDMYNNKPAEVITNANNPILCQTTTYTYDENGELLFVETLDSAGDVVETPDDTATSEDVEESDGDSGDDDDDIDDTDDSYEKEDEDEYTKVKSSDETQQ